MGGKHGCEVRLKATTISDIAVKFCFYQAIKFGRNSSSIQTESAEWRQVVFTPRNENDLFSPCFGLEHGATLPCSA